MDDFLYSGKEAGIAVSDSMLRTGAAFSVNIPSLPPKSKPIIDDKTGFCVGYAYEGAKNVWHIFDAAGQKVGIEEAPLENPLIDPYDLILLGPAVFKALRAGISAGSRLLAGKTAASATAKISSRLIPILRNRLYGLSARKIKFSEKAASRLKIPGRYVPIHILHLAIKHGKRMPDPQGIVGFFRYEIKIKKYFKRVNGYVKEEKTLEVLVRESDWTIMHFMYY